MEDTIIGSEKDKNLKSNIMELSSRLALKSPIVMTEVKLEDETVNQKLRSSRN